LTSLKISHSSLVSMSHRSIFCSLHDFSGHGWGSTTMPSLALSSRENVIFSADEKSSSPVTDAERCGDAEIRMSDSLW
jgi:hypothetical protein